MDVKTKFWWKSGGYQKERCDIEIGEKYETSSPNTKSINSKFSNLSTFLS